MLKLTSADIMREVENARYVVRVLMAFKAGEIKRKLGLMGEYRKHLDAAAKAVIDDSFYLAIMTGLINRPGFPFSGWLLTRRFKKQVKKYNAELGKLYKDLYGETDPGTGQDLPAPEKKP
jgi:hypothetical protein